MTTYDTGYWCGSVFSLYPGPSIAPFNLETHVRLLVLFISQFPPLNFCFSLGIFISWVLELLT